MSSEAGTGDLTGACSQGSTRSGIGLAHSPDLPDMRADPDCGRADARLRAIVELCQGSASSGLRSSIHSTGAWVRLRKAVADARPLDAGGVANAGDHGSTTQSDCASATPAPAKLADTTKMPTRISKRVAQNLRSSTRESLVDEYGHTRSAV